MAAGPWDLRAYNKREHPKWHLFISLADVAEIFIRTLYLSSDHCRESIDNHSGTRARQLNMLHYSKKIMIQTILIFLNVDFKVT